METTKQILKVDTKKKVKRKESKHTTREIHKGREHKTNKRNKRNHKTIRKQLTKWQQ